MKHLSITRKATHTFYFTLEDENGDTINISGATITMTAREYTRTGDAIITATGSIESASDGELSVKLTDNETEVPAGSYYYDVTVELSGERYIASHGILTILDNITA